MHLVIFEGTHWPSFAPFSFSRPVFMMPSGTGTLLEKAIRHVNPTRLTLWVRPAFVEFCKTRIAQRINIPVAINQPLDNEPALLMSGRAMHMSRYELPSDPCVVIDQEGEQVMRSAYVHSPGLTFDDCRKRTDAWMKIFDLPPAPPQTRLPQYSWDLLDWNEESLVSDAFSVDQPSQPLPTGAFHVVEQENIWLGRDVKIGPGAVLDANEGPIVLADGVSIGANAVIEGPCFLGNSTQVHPLTIIRRGCSIGPVCKVGGEIYSSIFMGYTNKQHNGFTGSSILGQWVNIGAGTEFSDRKNTYGTVTVQHMGRPVATDRRGLGSLIGDHSKLAIGSHLNGGTYVGYCCNLATVGGVPKYVPSFTWLTDDKRERYRHDKAKEVMTAVMARRGVTWGQLDEHVFEYAVRISAEKEAPI